MFYRKEKVIPST